MESEKEKKMRTTECVRTSINIGLKSSPADRDRNRQMEGERLGEKEGI